MALPGPLPSVPLVPPPPPPPHRTPPPPPRPPWAGLGGGPARRAPPLPAPPPRPPPPPATAGHAAHGGPCGWLGRAAGRAGTADHLRCRFVHTGSGKQGSANDDQ